MEENTQLPKEVVEQIEKEAEAHNARLKEHAENEKDVAYAQGFAEGWHEGVIAYATQLHQANETIKVLEYDNNKLKGEVEGYKNAVDELRTKYDNILATESGHESKTDNVWQKREAQPRALWVTADTKPEHNVGVLVFIPGEDNHITSGMWDISNKWVLLDEYRTPEEEVTHWMLLPEFPEGYKHDVISDEWVSTLKAIAKEELCKKNESAAGRDEADVDELWDEHAEYIDDNIDDLTRWAGSTVITREQFNKMMAKFKQQKD